jgi:uncharacterized protein YjbI with pentapeptide repeats
MENPSFDQYSEEGRRNQLLTGQPLHFPENLPEESRTVLAIWLKEAIQKELAVDVDNAIIKGPLNVKYAVIKEEFSVKRSKFLSTVNFSHATVKRVLDFTETTFDEEADFTGALIESEAYFKKSSFTVVSFGDARIRGVFDCQSAFLIQANFNRGIFEKTINFSRTVFEKKADFISTQIGGQAKFKETTFRCPALLYNAKIGQDAFFNPAHFMQDANFGGVRIGGSAYFDFDWDRADAKGAVFNNNFNLNMAKITKSLFFDRTVLQGEANFGSLSVGEEASFIGAYFGKKVNFDDAQIHGKALFHGTLFKGPVFFYRARFQLGAYFQHAVHLNTYYRGAIFEKLVSFKGASFDFEVQFDGELALYQDVASDDIRLGMEIEQLPERFRGGIDLRACTYSSIKISSWKSLMERLEPFDRGSYFQLEKTFRSAGDDSLANAVYYKRRCEEGKRKKGLLRAGDGILKAVVGYGVKPLRLFIWIFVLLLIGTTVFGLEGAVQPKDKEKFQELISNRCIQSEQKLICRLNLSEAIWLSLNTLLPVELPTGKVWEPSPSQSIMVTYKNIKFSLMSYASFASILKLVGWIIVPVGVAGLSGLLQRRGTAS